MDRRTLRLASLDDAVRDARALLAAGYQRAGTWSLGQNCHHLGTVITLSMDGFPWRLWWPLNAIIRWWMLGSILRHEPMHRRVSSPKFMMPPDAVEDAAGVEMFAAAVDRFTAHDGKLHPSPIFGTLTREQWREVHLWHSEHHLSFLIPK
jgi:hypothetical protein